MRTEQSQGGLVGPGLSPWEDGEPFPEMKMGRQWGTGWQEVHPPPGLTLPLCFLEEKENRCS